MNGTAFLPVQPFTTTKVCSSNDKKVLHHLKRMPAFQVSMKSVNGVCLSPCTYMRDSVNELKQFYEIMRQFVPEQRSRGGGTQRVELH